jgi:hypothetical protein
MRFGASPDLDDLLITGRQDLLTWADAPKAEWNAYNRGTNVRVVVRHTGSAFEATATDRSAPANFDTVPMRNLAQTAQSEIVGSGNFTISLGLQAGPQVMADFDGDGLPDWWEEQYGLNPDDATGSNGAGGDIDGDGLSNEAEFLMGLSPVSVGPVMHTVTLAPGGSGHWIVRFQSATGRRYRILYSDALTQGFQSVPGEFVGTGGQIQWVDDGSLTGGQPTGQRYYKIEASLEPEA